MFLKSFEFEDLRTGWKLERTEFDAFNLLVGNSGVGKTKILRALISLGGFASGRVFTDFRWNLEFSQQDAEYTWRGAVARGDHTSAFTVEESLARGQIVLFQRSNGHFTFQGVSLPRLSNRLSGIELLSGEESIRPIRDNLGSIFIESNIGQFPLHITRQWPEPLEDLTKDALDELRKTTPLHILEVAHAVYAGSPDLWQEIMDVFRSIFPTVERIAVLRSGTEDEDSTTFALELIEHSASGPIAHEDIASGMSRALGILIEIAVAPEGAVILIDEFENSLGANCMPDVVRMLHSRPDLQFIVTSHHPYVINNIPKDTWKLVQRRGSTVRVTSARDIPALQEASHHQAYLRLVNLPEFEEGIA